MSAAPGVDSKEKFVIPGFVTLKLSMPQVIQIGQTLGSLPYAVVFELIREIEKQVTEQRVAAPPPAA